MAVALPPTATLYPHACTVYRPSETINAAGKVTAQSFTTIQAAQACYFQTGQSVQSGFDTLIRGEDDNLFTYDLVHFPSTANLQVGDVLKQTTGPETGGYYKVQGNDKLRTQFAQKTQVMAARLERAPTGI